MNIHLLLTLLSTTTASLPLLVDSASLPDLTEFQQDPDLNDETVVLSFNHDPSGLVGQTQAPPTSGISTISQDTGPQRIESGLGTVHVEPSLFTFSSSDMTTGSRFQLTQNSPAAEKLGPGGEERTTEIYLCCESKGDNKFLCDYRER